MTSKIPKSTYYDKSGPNGLFTKATAGTKKITTFFNISDAQATDLQSPEPNEISSDAQAIDLQSPEPNETSSDSESEVIDLYACRIKRGQELKEHLEKQHAQLTVFEYNHKRAIFEYLTLLNDNNGHGRIDASLKVAQKVFIGEIGRAHV